MAPEKSCAMPLKALIVGGGIGDLTTALTLRRQGHEVVFASEVGAAVALAPNCGRLLNRFGFYAQEHAGTQFNTIANHDGSGKLLSKVPVVALTPSIEDWYLIHRAHLHEGIKKLALSPEGPGKPVKLLLNCRLVDVDRSRASVTTSEGEVYKGDFIVGADGVHDAKAVSSGLACYRWLSPGELLADDERTIEYFKLEGTLVEWVSGDRRMVHYPCVNNTLSNIAAFVPINEVPESSDGGSRGIKKEHVMECFKTFGAGPRAVIEQAPEEIKVWELMDMKPLKKWTQDRLILLGDAAHPFLPFMGQGAAQAMEDGSTLAALLPLGTTSESIQNRLMCQSARQSLVNSLQGFTRRMGRSPDDRVNPRPLHEESTEKMKDYVNNDAWKIATDMLTEESII